MAPKKRYEETAFTGSQETLNGGFQAFEEEPLEYEENNKKPSGCDQCMTRIPHATLIATIMCVMGVAVFCATMYRGSTITLLMFDNVFKLRLFWVEAVQMTFVIIGGCMGALGFMILTVGCLATGATRYKMYRAWGSRVGGRIGCAVFMGITYVLNLCWLLMFIFLGIVTFVITTFWCMCANPRVSSRQDCLDLTQFYFFFPDGHKQEHMKVCDKDIKLFCKDYVEKAEYMFILATVACILIIISLVHYLMCLAANYAHIRDHDKIQQMQDIQYLNETNLMHKDRF